MNTIKNSIWRIQNINISITIYFRFVDMSNTFLKIYGNNSYRLENFQ
jgi:hypothetical protein